MKLVPKLALTLLSGVFAVLAVFTASRVRGEIDIFDNDIRRDHRMVGITAAAALSKTRTRAEAIRLAQRIDASRERIRIRFVSLAPAPDANLAPLVALSPRELPAPGAWTQLERRVDADGIPGDYLLTYVGAPVVDDPHGAIQLEESLEPRAAYVSRGVWSALASSVAKLLRALENRCVRPIGGDSEVPFDARIIAATNRDLEQAVQDGRFREDLYYRLNVLHVALPALGSRGADIMLLAQHFLVHFARQCERAVQGISESAAQRLMAYPWPGNVRELRNAIERAVALTRFDHIAADDLPERIKNFESRHVVVAGDDLAEFVPLNEVERRYILRLLQAAGGNKSLAAQRLGISRRTLYRKLGGYGVGEWLSYARCN